ncbi:MAG: HAMP domain-containing histidine kinase [Lachnospiraceae bacterium]|nr:HAMP domain-containing histidine kinase [Lachnospiraceae bacterium]
MEYEEPLAAGWVIAYVLAGIIVLGALIAFGIKKYYEYRRSKGRPGQPKAMTAVTAWLTAAFVLIWGGSMVCLTIVQAEQVSQTMAVASQGYAERLYGYGLRRILGPQNDYQLSKDLLEYWELETVVCGDIYLYSTSNMPATTLMDDVAYPVESAVLFYDAEGDLKFSSRDMMRFSYKTEEEREADPFNKNSNSHDAWIDLSADDLSERLPGTAGSGKRTGKDVEARMLRITGTLSGIQMKPLRIEEIDYDAYHGGKNEGEVLFDRLSGDEKDLVTVYSDYQMYYFYDKKELTCTIDGESRAWESLEALAKELDFPNQDEVYLMSDMFQDRSIRSLSRILVFSGYTLYDWTDWKAYDENGNVQPSPPLEGYMITACQFHPLAGAIASLRTVYVVTGLVSIALLWMIRSSVKKKLAEPLARFTEGMGENWRYVYQPDERPELWREAEKLYDQYQKERTRRAADGNEITRLNTALGYAKTAEETRRQQTSALAHDLKTPLAVIHSHAEGLQAHIAEDRRDEYLSIILSETERMDELVMGLLDLSRLEAGKIRLAADEIRLDELAASAVRKFELSARERGMTLELTAEPCLVTADEGRIGQVIDNLLGNALRYAPADSDVKITVRREKNRAFFSVENDTERPFTEAELTKIWETFYRGDDSRNRRGTGLGLAIAKSIIELHGGRCRVKNTEGGAAFGFELPA